MMRIIIFLLILLPCPPVFSYESCVDDRGYRSKVYSPKHISDLVRKWAFEFDLSTKLVKSVIRQESNGRHDIVSDKGARGLMQLMPTTATSLGMTSDESLFDPDVNIYYGCLYLRQLMDEFKSERLSLIAYYSGPSRARQIKDKRTMPKKFEKEITNYADRILFRTGNNLGYLSINWETR